MHWHCVELFSSFRCRCKIPDDVDAAGALVDPYTVARGKDAGMDARAFLDNNDAYHFFEKTKDLLMTGPTNTNVMDVKFVLVR